MLIVLIIACTFTFTFSSLIERRRQWHPTPVLFFFFQPRKIIYFEQDIHSLHQMNWVNISFIGFMKVKVKSLSPVQLLAPL